MKVRDIYITLMSEVGLAPARASKRFTPPRLDACLIRKAILGPAAPVKT
jgi:hypothetical protein